jgi:hypothetical protein
MKLAVLATAMLCLLMTSAQARSHHSSTPQCVETGDVMHPVCLGNNFLAGIRSIKIDLHRDSEYRPQKFHISAMETSSVLPHPEGCPRRAFCGCGAAVRVFGYPVRSLWLAANWFRFPITHPAPGMVAVRRHHVFVLEHHIEGNVWLTYDANSGHHATRVHARSLSGYTIVNPRA